MRERGWGADLIILLKQDERCGKEMRERERDAGWVQRDAGKRLRCWFDNIIINSINPLMPGGNKKVTHT